MQNNAELNQCLAAPGLAIVVGSSTLVKYANTFSFTASGMVSPSITTANAPSLALATYVAPYPSGTASVVGNLTYDAGSTDVGTLCCQAFTLVATLPQATASPTATFSWLCGSPFSKYRQPQDSDFPKPDQSNQTAVGFIVVKNASSAVFIPGTTALDASGITTTYIDNYGVIGI